MRAKLGLMRDGAGAPNGYVLTLGDASAELGEAGERERVLRTALERQRGMLASLRAAAETLAGVPDLAPDDRATFEQVVLEETGRLCEQNANLNRLLAEMSKASWVMSEIDTGDLIAALARRMGPQTPVEIVQAGMPDWLFADSLSLLDLIEHLARMLARERGGAASDCRSVAPGPLGRSRPDLARRAGGGDGAPGMARSAVRGRTRRD